MGTCMAEGWQHGCLGDMAQADDGEAQRWR
jgi:hypothetical protein